MDVLDYLQRIDFKGEAKADYAMLYELQYRHLRQKNVRTLKFLKF